MQDCAPGVGACSIRTCRFPSYSQALEVGQTTDWCVSVHIAVTVQSVLIKVPPLAPFCPFWSVTLQCLKVGRAWYITLHTSSRVET